MNKAWNGCREDGAVKTRWKRCRGKGAQGESDREMIPLQLPPHLLRRGEGFKRTEEI